MKKIIIIILIFFTILVIKANVSAQEEASPEGDVIRNAVQEKIEEAQNKPVAYLGTVTDIVENTVQIKSIEGDIKQVSVSDDTDFVKINTTSNSVNFSDIAIGDFLVNMGFKTGDDVLEAKRTLVTNQPEKPEWETLFGKVTEKLNTEITVEIKDGKKLITITPERNAVVTKMDEEEIIKSKFGEIEAESIIIAVGTRTQESFSARSIHTIGTPESQNNSEESSE
jgi:hypothetical protein